MTKTAADHMEVRWRVKDSGEAWSTPQIAGSVSELVVAKLDRSQQYEFQARNVSSCGAKSNWAAALTHEVPSAPAGTISLSGLKDKADAAQVTADAAQNSVPIINPDFGAGDLTGWVSDHGTWSFQQGTAGPETGTSTYAIRTGSSGAPTDTLRNLGKIRVYPGARVKAACSIRANGANGTCSCLISWRDVDNAEIGVTPGNTVAGTKLAASFAIGTAPANAVAAHIEAAAIDHTAGTYAVDGFIAPIMPDSLDQVPDGPTYARLKASLVSNGILAPASVGDNVVGNFSFEENHLGRIVDDVHYTSGEVIDGWNVIDCNDAASWYGARWSSGRATSGSRSLQILMKDGGSIAAGDSKFMGVGGRSVSVRAGDVYFVGGKVWRDFSASPPGGSQIVMAIYARFYDSTGAYIGQEGPATGNGGGSVLGQSVTVPSNAATMIPYCFVQITNPSAGPIGTFSNYCYAYFDEIFFGRVISLATAVNGTLSTQRNLPLVTWGNYGGGWSGLAVTYSSTTSSCTFTASSGNYVGGGDTISYNSASCTVSGSAGSTVTYYLYYDDPSMTGGSKTLQATTDQITSLNAAGRVLVGKATVTYPTSGVGSGGGSTGCPQVDEPVTRRALDGSEEVVRAGDVRVGDYLLLASGRWGLVTYSEATPQPGVRVVGRDGSSILCSVSAPLETADGPCVCAAYVRDLVLKHRRAGVMRVADVFDAGEIRVQHITCEDDCFWVGNYSHHNMKPPN